MGAGRKPERSYLKELDQCTAAATWTIDFEAAKVVLLQQQYGVGRKTCVREPYRNWFGHAPTPIWFSGLLGRASEHMLVGQAHEHMLMGLAHEHKLMGLAHEHLLMGLALEHMHMGLAHEHMPMEPGP